MNTQRGIASFLVRFAQERWRGDDGEPHLQWRGHIQHVQGDEEKSFGDAAEAIAFIQQHLTQLTLDALPGGNPMEQEKLVRESFQLWEQFATSYNKMVFDAMEQTIKQSEAIKQQMDDAVERSLKAWKLPAQADQAQIVDALNKLQAQVRALAEKVDSLEKAARQNPTQ